MEYRNIITSLIIISICIVGATAWTYTDPTSPKLNYTTGFQMGNTSVNATDIIADNINPVTGYSYIVYTPDGTNYKAVSGTTGKLEFTGTNRYTVIQNAIDATIDGTVFVKSISLPLANSTFIFPESVTLLQDYEGVLNYYGWFGHTGGSSGLTKDHVAIRLFAYDNTSKPIIEWRDYNNKKIAWIVAHEMLNESGVWSEHKHISIETSDSNGLVYSRFTIGYGVDTPVVGFGRVALELPGWGGTVPGFRFNGDEDTRIWQNAADEIRLSTGGTTRLTIENDMITAAEPIFVPTGSSNGLRFDSTGTDKVWTNAAGDFRISTGGSSRVQILNTSVSMLAPLTLTTTKPSSGLLTGMMFFNTTSKTTNCYDGSAWVYCGNGTAV